MDWTRYANSNHYLPVHCRVTHAGAEQVDEKLPEWELDALIGLMQHIIHGMANLSGANTAMQQRHMVDPGRTAARSSSGTKTWQPSAEVSSSLWLLQKP
jgi:hypothetical protein